MRFIAAFLLLASVASAEIIPSARRIDWTGNCGVPGGIPTRSTNSATLGVAGQAPSYVQSVSASDINTAIASCASGQVVYLRAGTYDLADGEYIFLNTYSNITVRGAGPGQTIIRSASQLGGVVSMSEILQYNPIAQPGEMKSVASGYTKGSDTVVLAEDPPAYCAVGSIIRFYQDDEIGLVFFTGKQAGVQSIKLQFLTKVTAMTGTGNRTITFDPPFPYTFQAGLTPKMSAQTSTPLTMTGIEDMTILCTDTANHGIQDAISFHGAVNCWVKNVEVDTPAYNAVTFLECFQCEVRHCNFHDVKAYPANSSASGFGVSLYQSTSFCLVEDNIFSNLCQGVFMEGSSCDAMLYNYVRGGASGGGGVGSGWHTPSLDCNHQPHGMMNLWEGNIGEMWQADGYHGSASHQTIFRNWIHGVHPRADTQLRRIMIDAARGTYYTNVVGNILGDTSWKVDATHNHWQSPAPASGDDGVFAYSMDGNYATTAAVIYRLGFPGTGSNNYGEGWANGEARAWGNGTINAAYSTYNCSSNGSTTITTNTGSDPPGFTPDMVGKTLRVHGAYPGPEVWEDFTVASYVSASTITVTVAPSGGAFSNRQAVVGIPGYYAVDMVTHPDLTVASTMSRHGNYDTFNEGQMWETTNTNVTDYTDHTIPNSLYYTAKPSYFGTCPWPPFSPTSPGSAAAVNIPAGYRYVNGVDPPPDNTVATPTATPAAGTYAVTQSVTLTCATSGSTIHYTVDGTTPTSGSATYTPPLSVATTTTVKAIGVKSGLTNSSVGSFAYTITPAGAVYSNDGLKHGPMVRSF